MQTFHAQRTESVEVTPAFKARRPSADHPPGRHRPGMRAPGILVMADVFDQVIAQHIHHTLCVPPGASAKTVSFSPNDSTVMYSYSPERVLASTLMK